HTFSTGDPILLKDTPYADASKNLTSPTLYRVPASNTVQQPRARYATSNFPSKDRSQSVTIPVVSCQGKPIIPSVYWNPHAPHRRSSCINLHPHNKPLLRFQPSVDNMSPRFSPASSPRRAGPILLSPHERMILPSSSGH